jgi:hypothetical protein
LNFTEAKWYVAGGSSRVANEYFRISPSPREIYMKLAGPTLDINRRALISTLVLLPTLSPLTSISAAAQPQTSGDALPSWNEGPAKQAILDFVRDTTDQADPKFVPPEVRIVTFDQDGTLWVEHQHFMLRQKGKTGR